MRLAERIRSYAARLAAVGQRYVGLPLAMEFARAEFPVTGIDTDLDQVGALDRGHSYTQDIESVSLVFQPPSRNPKIPTSPLSWRLRKRSLAISDPGN